MTPDEIEKMKADIEAGTPGPWRAGQQGNFRVYGPDGIGEHSGLIAEVLKGRANACRIARVPHLEAEVLRLREALREVQEFLSNLNEDEPSRKMPAIQASAMCIHIERKCRAALNGGTDD